jgi:excisionase family DNA binding protein
MKESTEAMGALVESLDGRALDRLAELLAPRLEGLERSAEDDRWLAASEAARYLGMSLTALHKLSAARAIPFEQDGPGCKLWFRRSELDQWRRGGGPSASGSASTPLPRRREAAS